MEMDTKSDDIFTIDDRHLDREWLRQPGLTRDAGHAEADAMHKKNQAEARLAVVGAQLRLKIRDNPTAFGLRSKPNNDDIDAAIILEDQYQDALADVNTAKYELDIRKAHSEAMLTRRKALERRVELLSIEYYAENMAEPHAQTPAARETIERQRRAAVRKTDD